MADPVVAAAPAEHSPAATPPAAATPPVTPSTAGEPAAGDPATPPAEAPKTELGKAEAPKPAEAVAFDAAKLTVPEGMKADDPLFKSFGETMADAKLDPQARGQKLLDLYKDGIKSVQEAQVNAWKTTNEKWVNEVKADPEIGGAKFEPTKTSIAKAIDSLGPDLSVAFRQGLDATGAGNHPAIWKGLAKMAALLTEGGHVSGAPPKGSPDIGTTFFPNSKMK
jgi:hypothetical protein